MIAVVRKVIGFMASFSLHLWNSRNTRILEYTPRKGGFNELTMSLGFIMHPSAWGRIYATYWEISTFLLNKSVHFL